MKIMLVAGGAVLPELLRRPLEPLGHDLTVVPTVAELRRRVPELEPAAVLLPRRLPDAPLGDAVAWLRAQLDDVASGIDLRLTVAKQDVPLAGGVTAAALALLVAGAVLNARRTGRLV